VPGCTASPPSSSRPTTAFASRLLFPICHAILTPPPSRGPWSACIRAMPSAAFSSMASNVHHARPSCTPTRSWPELAQREHRHALPAAALHVVSLHSSSFFFCCRIRAYSGFATSLPRTPEPRVFSARVTSWLHRPSSARTLPHRELRSSAAWLACRSRVCSTPPARPRSACANRSEPLRRQSLAALVRPSPAPSPGAVSVLQRHHALLLASAGARALSPAPGPHQPSRPRALRPLALARFTRASTRLCRRPCACACSGQHAPARAPLLHCAARLP
jgi:hypothetical protein